MANEGIQKGSQGRRLEETGWRSKRGEGRGRGEEVESGGRGEEVERGRDEIGRRAGRKRN